MTQENTFVYNAGSEDRPVAYQGKLTKTEKSISWKIGEFGGNYTNGTMAVNIFTSVKTHALRAGAFSLANNTPYERENGSVSYPQSFLAGMIERKMALKSRDRKSGYEVWAVPGLAVRGEGFEKFLNLDDEVMVGSGVGKRGAAFELADRVAKALTKSVFINVKKVEAENTEAEVESKEDDDLDIDNIPF